MAVISPASEDLVHRAFSDLVDLVLVDVHVRFHVLSWVDEGRSVVHALVQGRIQFRAHVVSRLVSLIWVLTALAEMLATHLIPHVLFN